jgi:outer membrane protein TolC
MKKYIAMAGFIMTAVTSFAQRERKAVLTLGECQKLAAENYPLVKRRQLIEKTATYNIEIISKGYLPQLNVNGQATYQSAVTEIPIQLPGVEVPTISKDQYKVYGEVNQLIYDGGQLKQQKELQKADARIDHQKLETDLYQLKGRINQIYFGILLIDEQLKQNDILVEDINTGLKKMTAAVQNGIALKSQADVLEADLLKNQQRGIELNATRRGLIDMLSLFTGKDDLDSSTVFIKPEPVAIASSINRPELMLYDLQRSKLSLQDKLLNTKIMPRANFNLQAGVGRPALNMLSNNMDFYYIGGLKLTWSPSSLYTRKKEKALLHNTEANIDVSKETFLFNTAIETNEIKAKVKKYQDLMATDNSIIDLRKRIKAASLAQLENGVINSSDYLREVNAEDMASQTKILHEIQLLMAMYEHQITTGN